MGDWNWRMEIRTASMAYRYNLPCHKKIGCDFPKPTFLSTLSHNRNEAKGIRKYIARLRSIWYDFSAMFMRLDHVYSSLAQMSQKFNLNNTRLHLIWLQECFILPIQYMMTLKIKLLEISAVAVAY